MSDPTKMIDPTNEAESGVDSASAIPEGIVIQEPTQEEIQAAVDDPPFIDIGPQGPIKPDIRSFKPLTPARAKRSKELRETGFVMMLPNTPDEDGNPTSARVRRISMLDQVFLAGIPKGLSNKIMEIQADRQRRRGEKNPPAITTSVLIRELGREQLMADAYCIAGFMEPRVFETEAEADAKGGVWVGDIAATDRMMFKAVCEGGLNEAMEVLEPFLQPSASAVPDREDVSAMDGPEVAVARSDGADVPWPTLTLVEQGAD